MTINIRLVFIALTIIAVVVTTVCTFIYIGHLNKEIKDLNVTLSEQSNRIDELNCQIGSLEKHIDSFKETVAITNSYIENLEKAHAEEALVKQDVFNTVTNDPNAKEWYEEEMPSSLIEILLRESKDLTCSN